MARNTSKTHDKPNLYTIGVLAYIGLCSFNFGYPAAVIGTLLGEWNRENIYLAVVGIMPLTTR